MIPWLIEHLWYAIHFICARLPVFRAHSLVGEANMSVGSALSSGRDDRGLWRHILRLDHQGRLLEGMDKPTLGVWEGVVREREERHVPDREDRVVSGSQGCLHAREAFEEWLEHVRGGERPGHELAPSLATGCRGSRDWLSRSLLATCFLWPLHEL